MNRFVGARAIYKYHNYYLNTIYIVTVESVMQNLELPDETISKLTMQVTNN